MAVYRRTYKTYDGPLIPEWSRFFVLTRYSLSSLFSSRVFTWFVALCMFPVLLFTAYIYFAHSEMARSLLGLHMDLVRIDSLFFLRFLYVQAWIGVFVVAWAAPGLVSIDFANSALQLYLSRPLSRAEYLLGKVGALAVLLSCFTWVPGLLLFFLQAEMEGHGWGFDHVHLVASILVSSFLFLAVISLLALALSVWVRWRIAATALIVGGVFVAPRFGKIANLVLRTHWGDLMSLPSIARVIWVYLFRVQELNRDVLEGVPLWSAWAAVITLCLLSFWILDRRLKAREVVRG